MFRRIQIRSKLAGALAVPLVALVSVAGYEVVAADRAAEVSADEASLAAAAVGPGSLVSQLQNERNYASVDMIGMTDGVRLPVESNEEARAATDEALSELRRFVADQGPDAQAAFAEGLAAVEDGLAELRADIDDYDGPKDLSNSDLGNEVFGRYSTAVDALLDGSAGIAVRMDDADLRTGVELVDIATRLYELRSTTLRNAVASTLAGGNTTRSRIEVGNAVHEMGTLEDAITLRATGAYDVVDDAGLRDDFVVDQERMLTEYAETGELDVVEILATVQSGTERGIPLVRRLAADTLLAEAGDVQAAAETRRSLVLSLGAGTLVLALGIMVIINRSITRPLQSLTEQAEAMAATTLPNAVQRVLDTPLGDDVAIPDVPPIRVKTRDEVSDVAAALNTVQESALHLAFEQAVLRRNIADSFVNLGRRNQNLLDRQLDFITELEREESEPETLASLFRLDHLATRMRRNAESLLRLAGSEPQRKWSAPVEIGDVVRGALGEVEDYQRVHVRALDAAAVSGGAGADLAHALAELLENALSFSPPDEPVEVRGRRTNDGYVLAIADGGLGMTAEELAVANRRLAGEESFTVAPSRYLGHYVAGHLASRLGVRVQLQHGAAGGLVARLDIPLSMLVEIPSARTAPAVAPALHVVPALPEATPAPAPAEAPMPMPAPTPLPVRSVEPVEAMAPFEAAMVSEPLVPAADPEPEPFAAPEPPAPVSTTPGGLLRRVPGAQHPTTELGPRVEPDVAAPVDAEASAESVSSFLSDFSAGVARGIADVGRNPWEEGS